MRKKEERLCRQSLVEVLARFVVMAGCVGCLRRVFAGCSYCIKMQVLLLKADLVDGGGCSADGGRCNVWGRVRCSLGGRVSVCDLEWPWSVPGCRNI